VLGFLDHLVMDVAEFRGPIGKLHGIGEKPPLQHVLELPSDAHAGGDAVKSELRSQSLWLRTVPRGVTQGVDRRQLPSGIRPVDLIVRVVPGHVLIGVEVLVDGLPRQPANDGGERGVGIRSPRRGGTGRGIRDVHRLNCNSP